MEVLCCADGFGALAELERASHRGSPHDIVFIDQMMPGLSGEALAERIRANPRLGETKLVLISSAGRHGRGESAERVLDAILDKPIRQRDLLGCLTTLYADIGNRKPAAIQETGQRPKPAPSQDRQRPLKLLLAEDNKINQKFALALLAKGGHTVHVVENGHQAVDALRHGDYDVILMDIQMPELDGIQATRQIRAFPPPKSEIPIIALTAHALSGAREEYIAAGMNDYISKPIDQAILLSKLAEIAAALDGRDLEGQSDPGGEFPVAQDDGPAASGLDVARLDMLVSVMEPGEVRDFVEMFIRETAERMSRMAQIQEIAALGREAHALIGTSGNVGAMRVCDLARAVERACKQGDIATARAALAPLDTAFDSARSGLRSWLGG
jgi:CheY-like chemotaxis protein/HPt (histidine-containing phosphotransfer) domain-containing protein